MGGRKKKKQTERSGGRSERSVRKFAMKNTQRDLGSRFQPGLIRLRKQSEKRGLISLNGGRSEKKVWTQSEEKQTFKNLSKPVSVIFLHSRLSAVCQNLFFVHKTAVLTFIFSCLVHQSLIFGEKFLSFSPKRIKTPQQKTPIRDTKT